ncbi:hypothetical protein EDM55_10365 [Brevibacillus centrosporus]|nr:hypothetical protein EDM55_10365 [Brevibacillus centrosporus]
MNLGSGRLPLGQVFLFVFRISGMDQPPFLKALSRSSEMAEVFFQISGTYSWSRALWDQGLKA